jgi:type II secretory pathway predicted ATPase ExeA
MTTKKLQALYGLKWNPFTPDVPAESLFVHPKLQHFILRMEHKIHEGGFALITGVPGLGKSVSLRVVADRLAAMRDVKVGVISHPQSGVGDFYREMGDLFGVPLSPHNRWGGFRALRGKWHAHIEATLIRPVLFIDESQELPAPVLVELKTLMSDCFDSRSLLTTVLCGDTRLGERLAAPALSALDSRIRPRLLLESAPVAELADFLRHVLDQAGAPRLMTPGLADTLCEHAAGNYRVLCGLCSELLAAACEREVKHLDEKLFLEITSGPVSQTRAPRANGKDARR